MVNITSSQRITSFIANENLTLMKPWSERFRNAGFYGRRSWYINKLIKEIKEILILVSGNDVVEMLKGI
jgi:hypothetical protein